MRLKGREIRYVATNRTAGRGTLVIELCSRPQEYVRYFSRLDTKENWVGQNSRTPAATS